MYKAYNDMLPYNLQMYFEKSNCRRHIHCFKHKCVRTTKKQHCIFYCGVKFWNPLDDNLTMCNTVYLFKKSLKEIVQPFELLLVFISHW